MTFLYLKKGHDINFDGINDGLYGKITSGMNSSYLKTPKIMYYMTICDIS